MTRAALYLRVSTEDQTTDNQRLELEAWAERAGHEIVEIYSDPGISGAKGRDKRPGLDKALKDATRRKYDVLAVWSVDRLGRSLIDLVQTLQELHAAGVDLFIHQQALDTTTPAGKALFGMLGVFSEFERAIISERVKAGMERAKTQGTKTGRPLGRPRVPPAIAETIWRLRNEGLSHRQISAETGVPKTTIGDILNSKRPSQEP